MSLFGSIGYSYISDGRPLSCGTYCGNSGILNWAKTKVILDRIKDEIVIPCPNYQGNDSLKPEDLISIIGEKQFSEI